MGQGRGAQRRSLDALELLGSYQPRGVDPGDWAAVRPFVDGCLRWLGAEPDRSSTLRVTRALTRLATWACSEGLPRDVELLLDPDTVERFVAVGLAGDRSRATYRSVLRRIGPMLTTRAPWEARPESVARRQVAVPYTAAELLGLRSDALAQSTPGRVRAGRALLALGAGAGLDGRWVARVTADDVAVDGEVVLVSVGEPSARRVPVLEEWETEVVELAATAGDEFLVGGRSTSKNRAGALAASLVVANGHPRFSASRLRSTWLMTHLALGTRLPELALAAGAKGVTVLSDLLPYVSTIEDARRHSMLRGVR